MAVKPPVATGNFVLPPPRISGDWGRDGPQLLRWMSDFADIFTKVLNVPGTIADHERRITALEAEVQSIKTFLGI